MVQRGRRTYQKRPMFNPNMVSGALRLGKAVYKGYSSYRQMRKSNAPTQNTTTTQHDFQVQYRKKRMPKYKKKQWKTFTNKVNAVINKGLGTQSRLFNSTVTAQINATLTNQAYLYMGLYGKAGNLVTLTSEAGLDDLYRMVRDIGDADDFKLRFETGVIDLTLQNVNEANIEADLYLVQMNRLNNNYPNFNSSFVEAQNETTTITGANPLLLSSRGATLFDFPNLIAANGMKILKKTKYFVAPGQTITYQYRDPKNYIVSAQSVRDGLENAVIDINGNGFVYPRLHKALIVIFKKTPGDIAKVAGMTGGITRKYKFIKLENSTRQDGTN